MGLLRKLGYGVAYLLGCAFTAFIIIADVIDSHRRHKQRVEQSHG